VRGIMLLMPYHGVERRLRLGAWYDVIDAVSWC